MKQIPIPAIKSVMSVVGSVVSVVAIVLALVLGNDSGFLERVWPRPVVPPAVSIKVYGPAETLQGGEYYFHVDTTGSKGAPQWRTIPAAGSAITVFPDGLRASIQSNQTGHFAVVVAVAGAGGDVASDLLEFDNLKVTEEDPNPPVIPPPPSDPPVPTTTVGKLLEQAYMDVPSEHKVEEAKIIAGSVRALINRLNSGLLDPSTDVSAELVGQVETALGDKAKDWGLFLAEVQAIFDTLREQGTITTAASAAPALSELAAFLQHAK